MACRPTMTDEIIECILPYVQDPQDRASISAVCRRWYELDRWTRRHVTIAMCYAATPQRLHNRFPNLESLKLKGKPRASMFNLIPEDWGGYVTPWVDKLPDFHRLNSIHFRRMIVKDADLERIASVKGRDLVSLKLDKCSGFSTQGLLSITRTCRSLRTLVLEESSIEERNGEWFQQLALNNTVLETLNIHLTFLEQIKIEDLELVASNCPLMSVKIGDTADLAQLRKFLGSALKLQQFCGGSVSENENYTDMEFPPQLSSVGPIYFQKIHLPILFPISQSLRRLDLIYASLCCDGHCDLIRRLHNLEVLETTNVIGDEGLEIVATSCKSLKRLRIERGADDADIQGVVEGSGAITHRGLIAIAEGCQELEYIAVYVTDITNEAFTRMGANLKKLTDFRIVLLDEEATIPDLPLDNGVRDLLQGCQGIRRFGLYLRQGGLTDVGLGYIGQFGHNIRWLLLGFIGETDAGLLELSEGCPSLRKLEIRACCFTERALAIAATKLVSLRYMWVQGYRASHMGIVDLLQMVRPYWNIELIPGDQYDTNGDVGAQSIPSHIIAYYSLAGQRKDQMIIRKIYPSEDAEDEIASLKESIDKEKTETDVNKVQCVELLKTKTVRRGLIAGVGLQVFQQFLGINTVMYYSPTIFQLAGYASNQTALLLSLVTAGLNAIGSIASIYFTDRTGRKKLLIFSISGVILSLAVLTVVFHEATTHTPPISFTETNRFDAGVTCSDYINAGATSSWDCTKCLKKQSCGFCSSPTNKLLPGACLVANTTVGNICKAVEGREWYTRGCPSKNGWLALIGLALYIIFFSPGMGTVPWVINSEIYPLRYRGVCGGIAATSNWISNLIVAQSFLSIAQAIGTAYTFMIFGIVAVFALFFVIIYVPETKGLPMEEIEKMLEKRSLHLKFWEKNKNIDKERIDSPTKA